MRGAALLLRLEEQMRATQSARDISLAPTEADGEEGGGGGGSGSGSESGPRLWPSLEARQHWQRFARAAQTSAQAVQAVQCLRDHAAAFGLLGKREVKEAQQRCKLLW